MMFDLDYNILHSTCYGNLTQTGPGIYNCDMCKKSIDFDERNIVELKSAHMLPFASQSPIKATPNSHMNRPPNVPLMNLIEETSSEIGIAYNVKWTISDGITELDVFAAPRVDNVS